MLVRPQVHSVVRSSIHGSIHGSTVSSARLLLVLVLGLGFFSSPALAYMVKVTGLVARAASAPAFRRCAASFPGATWHYGARAATTAQRGLLASKNVFPQLPGQNPKRAGLPETVRRLQTNMQAAAAPATASAQARNKDPSAVAVIVGGSRGIGLAMVSDLITRFDGHIFATGRRPDTSQELHALIAQHPSRVTCVAMDVTNEQSVSSAAALIRDRSGGRVDLLVNTAGILHDASEPSSEGRMPERQLKDITEEWLLYNFKVNAMGPVLVAKHFQEMMQSKGPRVDKV